MPNFWTDKELIVALGPTTSSTATSTSAVVDAEGCQGVAWICGAGDYAAATVFGLITGTSATATGSTQTSITVSSADHLALFDLYKPVSRYSKVVINPGAGAVDGHFAVAIKYGRSVQPTSQGSTSVAGTTLVLSPSS